MKLLSSSYFPASLSDVSVIPLAWVRLLPSPTIRQHEEFSHLKLICLNKRNTRDFCFLQDICCIFPNPPLLRICQLLKFPHLPMQGIPSPLLLALSANRCGPSNVFLSFHQLFFLMKLLSFISLFKQGFSPSLSFSKLPGFEVSAFAILQGGSTAAA